MTLTKKTKPLQRVTLEMSLKPFKSLEPAAVERVCEEAYRQWRPLIAGASSVSILLWVSDGSEMLVWDGNLETEMEWAKYIGFANEWAFSHIKEGKDDPKTAIVYTEDPVRLTYGDLKEIIAALKRVGKERYGLQAEVGATFDAGPEFAYSDFKYKDHPEINYAELGGSYVSLKADYTVVCTWSKLKGDQASYAAYPDGIPDQTPFGQFLGRQCADYLPSLGFDYIWFSNGFALSYFPWTYLGANYNGKELSLADYEELSGKMLSFWDEFKRECPGFRTEIRGTNFGTAMDLAKDCVPLRELYRKQYVEFPPPNSPWGALNNDFGLELVGYMSRIAELPGTIYPFRYYPNDPWFWQNAWTDFYDREPHDIYCPLGIARINEEGATEPPGIIEIVTIDTERGELPEDTALEVSAHIRRALKDFPDEPGLLTWIYPFDELHEASASIPSKDEAVFFHDWFIRNAMNEGLPLNTVIGSKPFAQLMDAGSSALDGTILVASTFWLKGDALARLTDWIGRGGRALLYGPVLDEGLMELLNIAGASGLEGECELTVSLETDLIGGISSNVMKLNHRPMISDGLLSEVCANPKETHTRIRAVAAQGGEERVFALTRSMPEWQGGGVAWMRGSLPYQASGITHLPVRQDRSYGDSTAIARYLLQDFGYRLRQSRLAAEAAPVLQLVGRKDNAFLFTGYKQDTSVQLMLQFPDGVPLLIGQTVMAGPGDGAYSLNRTFHNECRIFVKQSEPTLVSCKETSAVPTHKKRYLHNLPVRKLYVHNLNNARLTLYPPLEAIKADRVEVRQGERYFDLSGKFQGNKLVLDGLSGMIEIIW